MRVVGLEEHFVIKEVLEAWQSIPPEHQDLALKPTSEGEAGRLVQELGPERIAAMDDAGIDIQVLSLTSPGVQNLDETTAVALARLSNDALVDAIRTNPDKFQGFATLPTPAPNAAARELDRAVSELGLQGAMVFGRTGNQNLDHPDYWPIFEVASALKAPLYIHPQTSRSGVRDAYYTGISKEVDAIFALPGIGWHYETGIQIIRLALAGVFERFPDLQIITGHMGEVMLYYLDRIDMLSGPAKLPRKVSEYIQQHVYVTPSGLFSQRYLRWAIEVLGVARIMMSTDYPFVKAEKGIARTFLQEANLTGDDQLKIASGNWNRLCSEIRR